MNTFKCVDKNFTTPAQFSSQSSNKIILNIADFDCKYDYITKDFRKTLSADKFPQIHISFENSKKQQRNLPFCSRSKTHEQGKTYTIEITENGKILSGKQQVNLAISGLLHQENGRNGSYKR
jgi:hypothetical protein